MTELKTLKDIPFPLGNDNLSKDKEAVNRNDLKIEAIKWLKWSCNEDVNYFIKMFFNITENDLNGTSN